MVVMGNLQLNDPVSRCRNSTDPSRISISFLFLKKRF
uniref:Uncharacterized protein n=1 Tax=Anguilla anguilla TaxID=7936 RepID=A0A0E9RGZ6_ANGAN